MSTDPGAPINGSHYITLKRFAGAQLLLLVLAAVAFYLTFLAIQAQRERSARNTCYLIRSLIFATPHGRPGAELAYINSTALRDCNAYGQGVTRGAK